MSQAQARHLADVQELSYPVYSDPTWKIYEAYETGHLGIPKQAWFVIDGEGIVRWVWRHSAESGRVPFSSEVLEVVDDLFDQGTTRS